MKFSWLLIVLFFCSQLLFSQNFADKGYYLIDSLVIDELSTDDKKLIDSCLSIYHNTSDETTKINSLTFLSEEMIHDDWIKYQKIQFKLIEKALNKKQTPSAKHNLLIQKAEALNNIGYNYKSIGNLSLALDYYNQSLKIEEEIEHKNGEASTLNNIGSVYQIKGEVEKALKYFNKAIKISIDNNNKEGIDLSYINIGHIYQSQGKINDALKCYNKSLKIQEEIGNLLGMGYSLNNIGFIYQSQEEYPEALSYHQKSLKIREKIGVKSDIAQSLVNIGSIYELTKEYDTALKYFNKSLKIQKKIGDKNGYAISLNHIGYINDQIGNNKLALEYYQQCLQIFNKIGHKKTIGNICYNIGAIYHEEGDYPLALSYTTKSLKLNREIGYPEYIKRSANLLSQIYEKQGKGLQALEMHKLFINMRDSINNIKTQKITIKHNLQYEFDKKEALAKVEHEKELVLTAAEKKQQKMITLGVSIGLILIVVFSVIIVNRLRISNTQKLIIEQKNAENELLLGEIHHRVKNNLQVISSLLGLQERNMDDVSAKAAILEGKERVKSMGLIHKMLYQNDNYSGVEMDGYVQKLVTGLLDSFGMGESKIQLDIDFSKLKLDVDTAIPMGLIINELVINALKYAYNNTEEPALKLKLKKQNNDLVLEIADNGKGKIVDLDSSNSFGMKLVKSLSRQLGGKLLITENNGLNIQINITDYKLV
jgi:two-component sensor histidine kinase/Tfp pilus assembly protein PilF